MASGVEINRRKGGSDEEEVAEYSGQWKGRKNIQKMVGCRRR